jgi:hypothetical protein
MTHNQSQSSSPAGADPTSKVFITWSQPRARALAASIVDWLPMVVPGVKPWMSDLVEKGAAWSARIGDRLTSAAYGIVIVTPENMNERWLLFEAGALAHATTTQLCVPLLLDLEPRQLQPPLSQLQAVRVTEREDVKNMVLGIAQACGANTWSPPQIEKAFTNSWPDLQNHVKAALQSAKVDADPQPRKDSDMLAELLKVTRDMQRTLDPIAQTFGAYMNELSERGRVRGSAMGRWSRRHRLSDFYRPREDGRIQLALSRDRLAQLLKSDRIEHEDREMALWLLSLDEDARQQMFAEFQTPPTTLASDRIPPSPPAR